MEAPKITKLSNGLTVVTLKKDTLQPVVNLRVGVGSRHETEQEAGITHNLEHLLAVANKRLTAQQKEQAFSHMRGNSNAMTGHEDTQFYCQVGREHLADAMKLIAEGILDPHLADENIEGERGAILAEMRQRVSNEDLISTRLFLEKAYGNGRLARDVVGNEENIRRFTAADFKHYMDRYYTSDNMILTVVGNVDHDEICRLAGEIFSKLPRKPEGTTYTLPAEQYRGGYAVRGNKEMQHITFSLGFPGSAAKDRHEQIVDSILCAIIGGGFASRLMKKLRTEKSLVYGASASPAAFTDTGVLLISEVFNQDDAREAVLTTCDELKKVAGNITEEELLTVKSAAVGGLERSVESTHFLENWLTGSVSRRGEVKSIEALLEEMQAVTVEEVNARAQQIFSGIPTVTAYGNGVEKIPSYEEITEHLGQRRELDASGHAKAVAVSGGFTDRVAQGERGRQVGG